MIEIRITPADRQRVQNNPVHIGLLALKRLKQRNVPVTGSIYPEGVEGGRLELTSDLFTGDTIYIYREDSE